MDILFRARFSISICTAWYGRYVSVRKVTGMRTARYRTILSKSTVGGRLREKSIVGGRLREKSTVGGRLREKKGRRRGRRGKEERRKKRRRRKNTLRRPRPRAAVAALARGSLASRRALARDFSPMRGERSRRRFIYG
ncbi:hypothetical protein BHM03_00010915 [Ensete ventricosum]|nr:hypothetical protein BHM03_00010915 [Ensete ventricosum]